MIKMEARRVYRGGGRGWFTLQAAANAEAKAIIKRRCYCDPGDEITPGETCHYHSGEFYLKMKRRLAKMALAAYEEYKQAQEK